MPNLIYKLAIINCKGCIAVLAEISALAIKAEVRSTTSLIIAMQTAIHALNNVITVIEE
jgi:hypothetical protein